MDILGFGCPEIRGTLWGLYHKDSSIWGCILGSPIYGNSHKSALLEQICRKGLCLPTTCASRLLLFCDQFAAPSFSGSSE